MAIYHDSKQVVLVRVPGGFLLPRGHHQKWSLWLNFGEVYKSLTIHCPLLNLFPAPFHLCSQFVNTENKHKHTPAHKETYTQAHTHTLTHTHTHTQTHTSR